MPDFDSGVSGYITGTATVKVHFPVDLKGVPDISCKQCPYFAKNYRKCTLNGEMTAYPESYVGYACPLTIETEE